MATLMVETESGIPRHNLRRVASSVLVSHCWLGLIVRWFQTAAQGQKMSIVLVEQFYDFAAESDALAVNANHDDWVSVGQRTDGKMADGHIRFTSWDLARRR